MRTWVRLRSIWSTLFGKDVLDSELDAELRASLDVLVNRYRAQGMSPEVARRQALLTLGGVEQVKEEVRDTRAGAMLDALLVDVRSAWRSLRSAPALTVTVVVIFALGIGASTAIFSVVHALLLKPLPYRDADRLVFIWLNRTTGDYTRGPMSGPDLRALRQGATTIADFGAIWSPGTAGLIGNDDELEQVRVGLVTTNFFDVLGAAPALGRTFRAEDGYDGAEPTAVIGWDLFERRFGADRSIVGRKIEVADNPPVTVIGVMPQGFRLLLPPDAGTPDDLQAWTPFWNGLESGPPGNLFLRVIGRMHAGVTAAEAGEEVAAIGRRAGAEFGAPRTYTALALQADTAREVRRPLLALFAGVVLLLAIACVNVVSLVIARTAARARETALRLALGGGRSRLIRQALAEGLLLVSVATITGVLCAHLCLRVLLTLAPASLNRLQSTTIEPMVLAFTLGVSGVCGLACALAPIMTLFRAESAGSLPSHWRTASVSVRHRTRATVVIVQTALTVVLLIGAGLLVRAFLEVLRIDPGFRSDGALTFRVAIPGRYGSRESFNLFAAEMQRRLAALPGVTGVGAISHLPYDSMPNWALLYSAGKTLLPDASIAIARSISPGMLEAFGAQLIEGRFFTEDDDDPKRLVTVVDDRLARALWPGRSALGQQLVTSTPGMNAPVGQRAEMVVVGVVRHLNLQSPIEESGRPQLFVSWRVAQRNPGAFVVRADRDLTALATEVRAVSTTLDRRAPIYDVRPLASYVDAAMSTRRFTMQMAAAFALAAFALTCIGIYSVLAYSIACRRREFGIRRALGADTNRVRGAVLREGLTFVAIGCAGGLLAAVAAVQLLRSELYAVHPLDPGVYGLAIAVVAIGAIVTCWIPAQRAAAITPLEALRME